MHRSNSPSRDGADSTMSISVKKSGGRTDAKVELHWAGKTLAGRGAAFRHPADCLTDEVGQRLRPHAPYPICRPIAVAEAPPGITWSGCSS